MAEAKLWATVARSLGAPDSMTDKSFKFKRMYTETLAQFERVRFHRQRPTAQGSGAARGGAQAGGGLWASAAWTSEAWPCGQGLVGFQGLARVLGAVRGRCARRACGPSTAAHHDRAVIHLQA